MNARQSGSNPTPPPTWGAPQQSPIGGVLPQPNFEAPHSPSTTAKTGDGVELWLGRYASGVVAAVLVFLGAAYFAVSFIPLFDDRAKVLVMFAASIALMVGGSALALVRQNGFTTALMGCGAGSLFISVLVAHMYFDMIPEYAAFGLILVWMLACLALVRKTQSLLLDIVLQLGLAVSVCLGFASGFDSDKLALLLGYQVVASIIVVGGNLMFCRKMYRCSLLLALALSLVTSTFIWPYCDSFEIFRPSENYKPIPFVIAVFAVQFVSATACAILLSKAVIDHRSTGAKSGSAGRTSTKRDTLILFAGAALWLNALRIDVVWPICHCAQRVITSPSWQSAGYMVATACMLALITAAALALVRYGRQHGMGIVKDSLNPTLTLMAVAGISAALICSIIAFTDVKSMPIGALWIWALLLVLFGLKAGGRRYDITGMVCMALEVVLVAAIAFPSLPERFGYNVSMALGVAAIAVLCALTAWATYKCGWRRGGTLMVAVASTVLVMSYFANCTPLHVDGWVWSLCCMVCAFIWVLLGFALRHDHLRLCGLVVVLLCVAKMALIDLSGLDSTSRMIAYICGGLMCFVVSALYNFATKRLPHSE